MRRQKALKLNNIERAVAELAAQKSGMNFNEFTRAALEDRARAVLGEYVIIISATEQYIQLPGGDKIKI